MRTAKTATRFANYIFDTIGFIVIVMLNTVILDGLLNVVPEEGSPLLGVYFFVLYFGYHFLFEYFFNRTPGKFITNTRVTGIDGQRPTAKTLILRNVCRLIPFDNLSFLFSGSGWHDRISKTQVAHIEELS